MSGGPRLRPPFLPGLLARARSFLRGVLRRSRVEQEMREEFRHHVEMRTDDLVARGLPPREAARRARREFGHEERWRVAGRAARGLRWVDEIRFSWIDVKLAVRMLGKHPALTLVAIFALAVGIPTGLAPLHLARALDRPLPEDRDDRIRAIRFWNPAAGAVQLPTHEDLELLSAALDGFDRLAAYRSGMYNVASADGRAAPVIGAEVTASTFALLGAAPLWGRTLDPADEEPGSTDVVVLGHDLWEARFAGDPAVVGRTVRIGRAPHTVVGVMPDGFRYPLNDQVWLPLRRASAPVTGGGGAVRIVGRLAEGVSDDEAQAELSALTLPPDHEAARGQAPMRLEAVPFSYSYVGVPRGGVEDLPEFHYLQLLGLALLLVACLNVAMLVFARTATRFQELAVRTALGAGRWRIVSQVFVETLVLAVAATGVGLLLGDRILELVPWEGIAGEPFLPYWLDLGVGVDVLPRAALLAIASATVAGVVPALRVTRNDVHRSIRTADAGRSGIRFGGGTSALVALDVAVAVGVIGFAVGIARHMKATVASDAVVGIPAHEYLAFELRLSANELEASGGGSDEGERLARLQRTVQERMAAEPEVRALTFADALPRMDHRSRRVQVEEVGAVDDAGRWVRVARVDVDFFRALEQRVLAGRDFARADVEAEGRPVIVNTVFVDEVLGGGDALGRRVRLATSSDDPDTPWHEIVGVVGHLGMNTVSRTGDPGVYLPEPPGGIHPLQVGLHLGAEPERFIPRLREIVAEADPTAILGTPVVLSRVQQGDWYVMAMVTVGLALLVGVLVALAASGIYAMMSFSVSERTREIGIRTALGASRGELVLTLTRRSLAQLGVGGALGIPLAAWFQGQIATGEAGAGSTGIAVGLALGVVALIAALSCVAPTRRALAVEAAEALRGEG